MRRKTACSDARRHTTSTTRLRNSGASVHVPREFVFMDRAALGLGSVFIHLRAEINWHRLFSEMIDGFSEAALAKRQRSALEKFGVALPEQ